MVLLLTKTPQNWTLDEVFSDPDLLYQIFRQYDFDALLWQEKVSSWACR